MAKKDMHRRDFLRTTGLGLAAFAAAPLLRFADSPKRPNIVWIFSDDHACQAIGAYGGRLEKENLTPRIDSLANEGMLFDRACVGNALCAPARATLLTGKHSHLNGQYDNKQKPGFNHDQQQFQKLLRDSGYQTAIIGKIHLDGKLQGFDHWEVLPGQGAYVNPGFLGSRGPTRYEGHCTDVTTDLALNWLKTGRDESRPFMLMIHHKAPHQPWTPAERFREAFSARTFPEPATLFDDYAGRGVAAHRQQMTIRNGMMTSTLTTDRPDRKAYLEKHNPQGADLVRWKYQAYMQDYLACVAGIDEGVGRVLDYLKASALDANTVVMYSSDQGFFLGEHGWYDKRFMYNESFRTPLLVRWPGVIRPGSRNADLVQNIDFAETFLDIAGAPIPDDMQGASLVPLMKGRTPVDWRQTLYYHFYEYPGNQSVRRHEGVADKRYKLIRFYGTGVPNGEEWEFYDLQNDPSEMTSIYDDPAQVARIVEMKKELQRLRTFYGVPAEQQ